MENRKDIIRWGIVGGGNVVETKSGPAFNIQGKSVVHAVLRRKIEDAEKTKTFLGAQKAYSDFEEMLADENIDAFYIALPPGLHLDYALKCANIRKPAYIEKPLTTTYQDALTLIDAFDAKNTPVFVAHYRRSLERFVQAKELIRTKLGQIIRFEYLLCRKREDDIHHPWLYKKELSGGGKFADIAPHSIDMFQFLFGHISEVKSFFRHIMAPENTEDVISLLFKFESGVIGSANYDFLSREKKDLLIVYGTDSVLEISLHGNSPVYIKTKDKTETFHLPFPEFIQAPMIEDTIDYLRNGSGTPCFARESLATVKIIESTLEEKSAEAN